MKKLFLVANWKSHKRVEEAQAFLKTFLEEEIDLNETDKHIILCPSLLSLPVLTHDLQSLTPSFEISFGAQNISPFSEGAYTGEEAASQVAEFAKYVIIGHSERRKEFNETDEILERKVSLAKQYNLEPIYCIQGKEIAIPEGVNIVAYEPLDAIGTGQPATPENAEDVAAYLKENKNIPYVLYGGSVTAQNVHSYTTEEHINGVLVGTDSLNPNSFLEIIKNA